MKISIVIPAFNEEKHIAKVIQIVNECKIADEIIVVDNNSTDNTSSIASSLGAKVVFCKKQGKGYAMETGIKNVNGDIIVFLDGDIKNYKKGFINNLVEPILNKKADFVKATFERSGGRVTELVAKPLLDILFPEMYKFSQPLSGMIAGKKSLLSKIEFIFIYHLYTYNLFFLYYLNKFIKSGYQNKNFLIIIKIMKEFTEFEQNPEIILTEILNLMTEASQEEKDKFIVAWNFLIDKTKTHIRSCGQPYYLHPARVVQILIAAKMDIECVISGLLHNILSLENVTEDEIKTTFGETIFKIVNDTSRITGLKINISTLQQADAIRKMLFAMIDDVRVILVKLADRLDRMRNLKNVNEKIQKLH
mgnify:CR=1 FL=1